MAVAVAVAQPAAPPAAPASTLQLQTAQVTKPTHKSHPGTPSPCDVMITSLDDFSTNFFWPLLVLGVWCLFEGGIYPIFDMNVFSAEIAIVCNKKNWPLPYWWTEVPWIMEVRPNNQEITLESSNSISCPQIQDAEEFFKSPEG